MMVSKTYREFSGHLSNESGSSFRAVDVTQLSKNLASGGLSSLEMMNSRSRK